MRYSENNQSAFVLGIAFLVLGMIYTTIFCFGFIRFCKLGKKTKYLGSTFYFSIVLSCLAYMANIALYLYNIFDQISNSEQSWSIEKQLLNTIYVPDGLFWIVYQSLFWTVVCLHYDSRLHIGQINELPYNPNKLIHRLKDIFIIYGIASLIVVLLFNFDYLSASVLVYIDIIINLSIPLQFIITSLYLQCKYSGSPFKSSNFENKANRLQKLIIFWTIMRLIQVVSNFLLTNNKELIQDFLASNLSQDRLLLYVAILIIDLLLTNIIPFILALRQQAVSIFGGRQNVTASSITEHPMRQQFLNDDSSILDKKQIQFSFKELEKQGLNQQEQRKKENGFGKIIKYNIKSKQYGLRVIEYKQIQQYLIEQIKQEVEQINSLSHQYLYHIHGLDFTDNKIIYLVKFYQTSLHDYLKQQNVTVEEKIEILIQLLRGLSYLNGQNIYHGSLSTYNIMINKNGRVKIVDFGIYGIKKYLSLTQGYTNKSGFTAPELLSQKGLIVNGTSEGDVYSIGMIIFEMFEKKVPFEGLSIQNIQECMNKAIRPKIESNSIMDDIIRWCWQQEYEKRPKIDYGSIVVGSNIYKIEFTDEVYVYSGNQVQNTIQFRDGLIISPKKLDLPEYKFNRSERAEIISAILREAINYLEYPKVQDLKVMNVFEISCLANLMMKSYPTLQFQLLDSESPAVLLDVRKSYFSLLNCYQIIKSLNTDPTAYFKNKYVLLRYPQKQMVVKIKSVVFDQEFIYKNQSLEEYFRKKFQIVSKSNVYLETYNTDKVKNQFLIAEFCDLKQDYIEPEISQYCAQLEYWNKIINNSSQFLNFLNQNKLILCGETQEQKLFYLDSPNILLNGNLNKSLYQIVTSRTANEFEYFYGDIFLKNPTTFTTSLTISKLLIFVQREIIESREHFRSFLEKLDYFIKTRNYKIAQPQIFDINNNLNELIEKYATQDSYVFLIGDNSHEFQQARSNLLSLSIPNQIIILPIIDSEMNRLLAMMTANLGSVPWSIKEINGYINNKKTSVLGIWKSDDKISACLSINKSFNKYISSYGDFDETITILLGTYYATHKILSDQLIVFAEDDYQQQLEQKIQDVIQLIRDQGLAQQIVKPEVVMVQVNDAVSERYFTYIGYFDPYYCKNPSVGNLVTVNEKLGRYSVHTQRGESGCSQAQKLQISAANCKEICQLYYQLIFLCFDLSSSTYLPAPLHYAKKLSRHLLSSETYKKAIEKGQLLFV